MAAAATTTITTININRDAARIDVFNNSNKNSSTPFQKEGPSLVLLAFL